MVRDAYARDAMKEYRDRMAANMKETKKKGTGPPSITIVTHVRESAIILFFMETKCFIIPLCSCSWLPGVRRFLVSCSTTKASRFIKASKSKSSYEGIGQRLSL